MLKITNFITRLLTLDEWNTILVITYSIKKMIYYNLYSNKEYKSLDTTITILIIREVFKI